MRDGFESLDFTPAKCLSFQLQRQRGGRGICGLLPLLPRWREEIGRAGFGVLPLLLTKPRGGQRLVGSWPGWGGSGSAMLDFGRALRRWKLVLGLRDSSGLLGMLWVDSNSAQGGIDGCFVGGQKLNFVWLRSVRRGSKAWKSRMGVKSAQGMATVACGCDSRHGWQQPRRLL